MIPFNSIFARAARRRGGEGAVERALVSPRSAGELAAWPFDDGALYGLRLGGDTVMEGSRGSGGKRGFMSIELGPTLPFC